MSVYKRNETIDWEFYRAVPIEEVADILGLDVDRHKKFCCPAHNDTHPSAKLNLDNNTWKCFACGEGGSPIDLVMASEKIGKLDAIKFLENYYKEGITRKSDVEDNTLMPPQIPKEFLTAIGLKTDPFAEIRIRSIVFENKDKEITTEQSSFILSCEESANLVMDKITDYINGMEKYAAGILQDFPRLGSKASSYIWDTAKEHIARAQGYLELCRNYADELLALSGGAIDWEEETNREK